MTCPYCKRNCIDAEPTIKARKLLSGKLMSEVCNPGGRELVLKSGKHIQLTDCCSWCDYETIKKELENG